MENIVVLFNLYVTDSGKRKELGPNTACITYLLTLYLRLWYNRRSFTVHSGREQLQRSPHGINVKFPIVSRRDPYINPERERRICYLKKQPYFQGTESGNIYIALSSLSFLSKPDHFLTRSFLFQPKLVVLGASNRRFFIKFSFISLSIHLNSFSYISFCIKLVWDSKTLSSTPTKTYQFSVL